MKKTTNYSAVFIFNPEKLLHINNKDLKVGEFNKIIRNFNNSEKINNYDFIYIYTKMKERISPNINDAEFLDTLDCDELINYYNPVGIYYIKNDNEIENLLEEKIKYSPNDLLNKCDIHTIDLSDNNEILLDTPDWLKNNFDASKDIDEKVRFFGNNIYEINNNFFLYSEREELEEIKNIVHLKKPFFVIGERGSGKTAMIENAVKAFLRIPDEKFVSVACGTLLPDRAQSDLFGHTKEAYTDAQIDTKGFVGKADGGCLYLDEVQDLSKEIQRILIKGIQEHKFYQVGASIPYESNFLLVCSSNKPLSELRKYMHEDFYDRISVFQIKIPSIEERKKDKNFISKCLPSIWKNYRKDCSSPNQFCEYDQLDNLNLDSPELSIKEKIISALNKHVLRGNFRDIEKLLAYIELYVLNDNIILLKGESSFTEINNNIDKAIHKWEDYINERNSYLPDNIPSTLTDDFIKNQTWKSLNKMFRSWIAEQAVKIYGSVNAAAEKLCVDKNSIRNNLPEIKNE